jgi:AraC-like DNA-binding protein
MSQMASRRTAGLDGWNQIVGDAFTGCVVDAAIPRFAAELAECRIDDFGLVRINAQASRVQRWQSRGPARRSGTALLHLHNSGIGINRQYRREVVVNAGEGALCDPDQAYEIDFTTNYDMFVMELPVARILDLQPGFDVALAGGQAVDAARAQLLLGFLNAAWDQRTCLIDDADWRDCVARVAMDLALRAISPLDETCGQNLVLQKRVIAYVTANLDDPGLRTSSLAAALGVSARSVQTVFEKMATTASAFILQARLRRAAERLRHRGAGQSITQIAFDCGFSDSAYFSRCFHKHYGMSPRSFGMM